MNFMATAENMYGCHLHIRAKHCEKSLLLDGDIQLNCYTVYY